MKTTAKDWLDLDLKSQSGAIWNKSSDNRRKNYKNKLVVKENKKIKQISIINNLLMKKSIFIIIIFLSASVKSFGQISINSIKNNYSELIINDTITIKKGDSINVFLPLAKDFIFIKPRKVINTKLLGKITDVVGAGASVVGVGTNNIKILTGASNVIRKATVVQYGIDAIEKIQNLPISNNAKKIAGKKIEIEGWELTNDGYVLMGNNI